MILGIVGSEAKKFTVETEAQARAEIRRLITEHKATQVVSGRCHLGGIDIWAKQEADALGIPVTEFPPRAFSWSGGYKPRNMKIAEASDLVVCITIKELPIGYVGMRFDYCYHCKTDTHVKSGGCWTVKYTKEIGKQGDVVVLS